METIVTNELTYDWLEISFEVYGKAKSCTTTNANNCYTIVCNRCRKEYYLYVRKIEELNDMLREAEELSEEIIEWYHEVLLDIDSEFNVDDEIFDATNVLFLEGIDLNAIYGKF